MPIQSTPIELVLSKLPDAKQTHAGQADWMATCPAHDDKKRSLHVSVGRENTVLLKCHAGCDTGKVASAMGLTLADLFIKKEKADYSPQRPQRRQSARSQAGNENLGILLEAYDYVDEAGQLLYQSCRFEPKTFRQRRPDPYRRGNWIYKMTGVRLVPYRLPAVLAAAKSGGTILICEGEKDVHTAERLGFVATTNAAGAGKWRDEFSPALKGANVVLIPDNDEPGRRHMDQVAESIKPYAKSVRLLTLPDMGDKEDLSDWAKLPGSDNAALQGFVDAAPEWTGPTTTPKKEYRLMSAIGNAERFADAYADMLRFDHTKLYWHVWDGKVWAQDVNGSRTTELAKFLIAQMYADAEEAKASGDFDRYADLLKHAVWSDRLSRVKEMLYLAAADPKIRTTADQWDRDHMLFNCQSGIINLKNGCLLPHDKAQYMTRISPASYDPDNLWKDPKDLCPVWDAALRRWVPSTSVRDFLMRSAGYSLTGLTGEEKALFLYGSGRNGKSKFLGGIAHVAGTYARRIKFSTLAESTIGDGPNGLTPALVPLDGARLVIASEIKEGQRIDEAFIKDLTGGDVITINPKGAPVYEMTPRFTLWLSGNHKPKIGGDDEGIWARICEAPFTEYIPAEERDTELEAKLIAEQDGILAWMVRGCLLWQKEGMNPPPEIVQATANFRAESDPFGRFLNEKCQVAPLPAGTKESDLTPTSRFVKVSASALRDAYLLWMKEEGEDGRNVRLLSGKEMGARLQAVGCIQRLGKVGGQVLRLWYGIGLKAEMTAEDADALRDDLKVGQQVGNLYYHPDGQLRYYAPASQASAEERRDVTAAVTEEEAEEVAQQPAPEGPTDPFETEEEEDPFG